jgi:hypothetical protein
VDPGAATAEMRTHQGLAAHVLRVFQRQEPLLRGCKRKNQQVTGAFEVISNFLLLLVFYTVKIQKYRLYSRYYQVN